MGYRINQIPIAKFKVSTAFFSSRSEEKDNNSFESRYLPGDKANSPEELNLQVSIVQW